VTSILRILRAGVLAALATGLAGWAVERTRFGASDQSALARVDQELRDRLDGTALALGAIAGRVTATAEDLRVAPRDPSAVQALFDQAAVALRDQEAGRTGLTIYAGNGTPMAWAGRVFDLPKERLDSPAPLFVASGALGPRLVRVQAVAGRTGSPRAGTIVVEQSLGSLPGAPGLPDTFTLATSLVPVQLRARLGGASPSSGPFALTIPVRDSDLLVEAEVSPSDLAAARDRWRRLALAAVLSVLGVTLLLCAGPLIERRRRSGRAGGFIADTIALLAVLLAGLILLSYAARAVNRRVDITDPVSLLLFALGSLAMVCIAVDLVERRRVASPRPPLFLADGRGAIRAAALSLTAGVAGTAVLAVYERLLHRVVDATSLDVLHFSLHPLSATRLFIAFALVLLHAAAIWTAVVLLRCARLFGRARRSWPARGDVIAGWLAGIVAAVAVVWRVWPAAPVLPLSVALAAAGGCAVALGRVIGRVRRLSQAARLGVFLLALLAPALAMYPSLVAFATDAKERLVATTYGPDALTQREDLQHRLQQAIEQIDAIPSLSGFVTSVASAPSADRAFFVWSRTDLAAYRLTSAVELYSATGRLVSRFANLPEYTTRPYRATSCSWEPLFDEVSPFGSSERHVLRTAKGICERGAIVGTIVVRAKLEYRTLPLVSAQSPYLESLQLTRQPPPEGVSGRDVEFAMYGWSRVPILESGATVWTLPDSAFQRLVASRDRFWTTLDRGGDTFRVYFLSDRGAIYALGYPVITWFGHAINIAELVLLTVVLYVALLLGSTVFGALTARTPDTGRALLREIRSSFYRKLFIAYVAGAIVPVAVLAFAIRTYFASQLSAGAEEAAQRTVTTAQRLVEDYAAIQQSGSTSLGALDDQIMMLVRRAIDEDVNLFDRGNLQATSARDLFASLVLSTRTPGDVYRHILLGREPTFVGDEEVGDVRYRLAAAPVRAGGREGIVTVPLSNRQEIEDQIDELDRRVRGATVLFSLLGAALGYWMAERIADPVSRLTRATRRIARGDLDARIAATSSDELRRLVEDFNQMAADLQRQRAELERTQRLEAWADMARQVAHDIKNPLTPIQLSAEHAQRVNRDRGGPLSPVLDECVAAILTQVKLLRQISAEFSSFASSPTPRPELTPVPSLVEEVVDPYRTGLSERIAIELRAPSETHTPPVAMIDRTLFARALTNVIENALHAMPGKGRLTITTQQPRVTHDGRRVIVVDIADTGVGMDREALSKIFEPYFSTKATGTGLGLTIAKRNVELNGGTIDVRSERGVGTTVTMTLPAPTAAPD
jgi:signal transduction histidine kinase